MAKLRKAKILATAFRQQRQPWRSRNDDDDDYDENRLIWADAIDICERTNRWYMRRASTHDGVLFVYRLRFEPQAGEREMQKGWPTTIAEKVRQGNTARKGSSNGGGDDDDDDGWWWLWQQQQQQQQRRG
ncbi:unnamed protein product [Soboliphyme baturini]|uniref:PH domain-containing protein n=1 Tax=Soboliphyme baturini TaxID=241478 RepID=A0A183IJ13_9BILA|nr:unnamed protein product [Soboliphyme baturini]